MNQPPTYRISAVKIDQSEFRYGLRVMKLDQKGVDTNDPAHKLSFYRMMWVVSGKLHLEVDMADTLLEKDHCLFIGKNQVVRFGKDQSFEAFVVDFTEAFYSRSGQDIDFLETCNVFHHPQGGVSIELEPDYKKEISSFLNFFKRMDKKRFDPLVYHLAHNTVERMLLYAEWNLRQNREKKSLDASDRKEYELVKNFKNLISLKYASHKDVGFYAQELNIPPKRLNKACQLTHQPSPKKLILERIILEAKRKLKFTDLTVKEISWMLGYEQVNSFIKVFTTYEGKSPRSYRKESSQLIG